MTTEYAMNTTGMTEEQIAAAHTEFAAREAAEARDLAAKVTLREILQKIDAARARMGVNNPHRLLLLQCGAAICELAERGHRLDQLLQMVAANAGPVAVEPIGLHQTAEATA